MTNDMAVSVLEDSGSTSSRVSSPGSLKTDWPSMGSWLGLKPPMHLIGSRKSKKGQKPKPRRRSIPSTRVQGETESPITKEFQSSDDTELTMLTLAYKSFNTRSIPTPGDSLLSEVEDEDIARAEDNLADLIIGSRIKAEFNRGNYNEFLPEGLLARFLTKNSVHRELTKNNISSNDVDDLVAFIVPGAGKIFAILLLLGYQGVKLQRAMQCFRRDNVGDDFLPITEENRDSVPFFLNSESPWNWLAQKEFCYRQWAVLAPVLPPEEANGPVLQLHGDIILPFIKAELFDTGASGEVYKVLPSESNIRLPELKGRWLAVKRIKKPYPDNDIRRWKQHEAWAREVDINQQIKRLNHPHIVEFIAAMVIGEQRYLVFLFADQGDLLSLRRKYPTPQISTTLVKAFVLQVQGLFDALDILHNCGADAESSFRHGDLKPANILSQSTPGQQLSEDEPDIGNLMICDFGSANRHSVPTNLLERANAHYSWRYIPPEAFALDENQPTWDIRESGRGDIWSIGCVTLEFLLWLLYGNYALVAFIGQICVDVVSNNVDHVYDPPWCRIGKAGVEINPIVEQTINFILEHDPECRAETALAGVLKLLRDKILVFKEVRAVAREIKNTLHEIRKKGEANGRFWYSGADRTGIWLDMGPIIKAAGGDFEYSPGGLADLERRAKFLGTSNVPLQYELLRAAQLDRTNFTIDKEFAENMVSAIDIAGLRPDSFQEARLCFNCQSLDFFAENLTIDFDYTDGSNTGCEFCALLWEARHSRKLEGREGRKFRMVNSMLYLESQSAPVLSVCRSPVSVSTTENERVKIGFPHLTVSDNQHFELMRHWVKHCNDKHACKPQPTHPAPTRVIDVGTKRQATVYLYETSSEEFLEYTALSHCWGKDRHFVTTATNIEDHKRGIAICDLPKSFQHAIRVTRELGIRYLWVDSICIIQGDNGDFDREAEKMETVFSSAYCVLAASSAQGQHDGFLNPRKQNRVVSIPSRWVKEEGVFVSPVLDDFKQHVLNSPLSKRGWVLQERALARRTIYFTEWQTYWECGDGVRCETLTKMNNKLVSFLGDPDFPSKISDGRGDRKEKIRFYEGLYKQYSRLVLTCDVDRPIAIAGLEKRLIRSLRASGGFGAFEDGSSMLYRSLLWLRGEDVPTLAKIRFDMPLGVPTWSWMAYKGGIDYLEPPFGAVDWNKTGIKMDWASEGGKPELSAVARGLRMGKTGTEDFDITWDVPDQIGIEKTALRCVILGVSRNRCVPVEGRMHFVLVIVLRGGDSASMNEDGEIYERVGVGRMLGRYIDLDDSQLGTWLKIW